MPATNGTLTPPSSHEIAAATALGTKRKRAGSENGPQVNGANDHHEQAADAALQSDILVVLRRFDTSSCLRQVLNAISVLTLGFVEDTIPNRPYSIAGYRPQPSAPLRANLPPRSPSCKQVMPLPSA